jgi:hypothetical protein
MFLGGRRFSGDFKRFRMRTALAAEVSIRSHTGL